MFFWSIAWYLYIWCVYICFTYSTVLISSLPKVCNLGVIFDNYLSLDAHISNICRSTHFHLRNIGQIRTLLTFHATAQLIHALITTRLDFCNSIFYNLPNNKIERLQRIQKQHVC